MPQAPSPVEAPLIRCESCDLLQRMPTLRPGESACCPRCDLVLAREKKNSLDRSLSLTLAALILWVVANTYPFMVFSFKGRSQENLMMTGVLKLWEAGSQPLASLIFFASILAPLLYLSGMLYVLLPLRLGRKPWGLAVCYRALEKIQPWSMLEVYLLGVMVAVVKLAELASIVPGEALWAFAALILISTAARSSLDSRVIWKALER